MPQTKQVLKNKVMAYGYYRISKDANQYTANLTRPDVPAGCFEDEAEIHLKGPLDTEIGWAGAITSAVEAKLLDELEADESSRPCTLLMGRAEAGTRALMAEASLFDLQVGGTRGELASFDCTLRGASAPSLGHCLYTAVGYDPAGTWVRPVSANTTGPAVLVGALSSGKELRAHLHILDPPGVSGTGPQLTAVLESSADQAFSVPVLQHTFVAASEPGTQVWVVDGNASPETDTYYRIRFEVAGTSPSFAPLAALSIRNK